MKAYKVDNGTFYMLWIDNVTISYMIAERMYDNPRWGYFDEVRTKLIPLHDILDHHGYRAEEIKLTKSMEKRLFVGLL